MDSGEVLDKLRAEQAREKARRIAVSAILGGEILRALGLEPAKWNVTTIHIDMKDAPKITLERILTDGDASAIVAVLEHYVLAPRHDGHEESPS